MKSKYKKVAPHIDSAFRDVGFQSTRDPMKLREYSHVENRTVVYLRKDVVGDLPIRVTVSPTVRIPELEGIEVLPEFLHHSNQLAFSTRLNAGKNKIHCGKQVLCNDEAALVRLLKHLAT